MSEKNDKNTSDLLDGAEPEGTDADDQNVKTDDDQKPDEDAAIATDDSSADDQADDDTGKDDDDHEAIAAMDAQKKTFDERHALMLARTTPANPAVADRTSREDADRTRADEADSSVDLGEDGEDTPVGDLSVAQFNKLLDERVKKGIDEGLGRSRQADGVLNEKSDMYAELSSLAKDYSLTKEEVDEAIAEGNLMVSEDDKNIPGGSSRFARAVGKEMLVIANRKARPLNDRKAAADAEDKVRKQLAAQQPGKIDAPPGKVLSEKDERLDKMNSHVGKNITSLIDK